MHLWTHKAYASTSSRFGALTAYKKVVDELATSLTARMDGVRTRTSYTPVLLFFLRNREEKPSTGNSIIREMPDVGVDADAHVSRGHKVPIQL